MNIDDGTIQAAEVQLRDEHRAVNALFKRILDTTDRSAMVGLLGELHTTLHQHFANEEYPGGLYERLGVLGGRFRDDVRHLVDDHYKILGSVRDLADRCRAGNLPEVEATEELVAMVEWLREHEELEHRLASEARHLQ